MPESYLTAVAAWFPIVLRLTAFLLSSAILTPLVGQWRLRVVTAIALATLIAVSVGQQIARSDPAVVAWSPDLLARELVLGLSLGLISTIVMEGFRMAGDLVLAGLTGGGTTGPDGQAGATWSHLYVWLGWTLFFASGGHCSVFDSLLMWCREFPPGSGPTAAGSLAAALQAVEASFRSAWGVAVPVVTTQWIAQLIMAAVARVAPMWVSWASVSSAPACVVLLALGWWCVAAGPHSSSLTRTLMVDSFQRWRASAFALEQEAEPPAVARRAVRHDR